MYYVSRKDASGRIYVIDTEDGVEEYVPRADLEKLLESGVHIEGVYSAHKQGGGLWISAYPYQPVTQDRAKLLMSQGLDVSVTPNGVLTSMDFSSGFKPCRIKLSAICDVVGAHSITYSSVPYPNVVLAVDDKLTSFEKKWFGRSSSPLMVDLIAVTRDDLLDNVYSTLVEFPDSIIDSPDRYTNLYLLHAIKSGVIPFKWLYRGESSFPDDFILKNCRTQILKHIKTLDAVYRSGSSRHLPVSENIRQVIGMLITYAGNHIFTYAEAETLSWWLSKFKLGKSKAAFAYVIGGGIDPEICSEVQRVTRLIYDTYYRRSICTT